MEQSRENWTKQRLRRKGGDDRMSLENNTTALEEVLELANSLPDAGEGAAPVIEALTVTENGVYTAPDGVDGYSPVTVNVPETEPVLQEKTATENGEITPDSGYDGLSKVTVNVSGDTTIEDGLVTKSLEHYENDRVTLLPSYAFHNWTVPFSLRFPNVTTLGLYTFMNNGKLVSIDFGSTVTVKTYAFYKNTALTALIFRSNELCPLSVTNAFTGSAIASGTGYIYVPSALLEEYKAATNWSTHAAQFRALEDYTVDGTTTGALDETKIAA